jgi:transcriptional regulator with XRE-family HTH domain
VAATFRHDLLKPAREKSGLSAGELARRLHVDRQTVIDWEQGKFRPRQDRLADLADAVGLDLEDLFARQEPTYRTHTEPYTPTREQMQAADWGNQRVVQLRQQISDVRFQRERAKRDFNAPDRRGDPEGERHRARQRWRECDQQLSGLYDELKTVDEQAWRQVAFDYEGDG